MAKLNVAVTRNNDGSLKLSLTDDSFPELEAGERLTLSLDCKCEESPAKKEADALLAATAAAAAKNEKKKRGTA